MPVKLHFIMYSSFGKNFMYISQNLSTRYVMIKVYFMHNICQCYDFHVCLAGAV